MYLKTTKQDILTYMPRSHAYIFILQSGLKQLSGIYITYLKCWWEILVILLLLLSIEIEIEGEVKFELLHIQELINRISISEKFCIKSRHELD